MIDLGYELGSGARVKIPLNHMAILGQTQLSGKTTTMEAVALRGDVRAISFITKPGEKSFRQRTPIPAFFSESTIEEYWKYVVAIVENLMAVKLGWQEKGWITKLCQDYERAKTKTKAAYKWRKPKSLRDLLANVEIALPLLSGTSEMICLQLREYLKPAVKEIERTEFSAKLELRQGINVMDITELSDGLKSLVIRSVIEWVHKHGRRIVVIIPEAWKFIPEGRSTPVKLALEGLIREGAGVGNFVWMDSQDLRGVDKMLCRSVIVWLFGVQRQKNEVVNTLASIPDHPKPSATEIMQLGKGEFYVCYGSTLVHTYVQPAGMEDVHAQAIARGEERPESWPQIVRSRDEEEQTEAPPKPDVREEFAVMDEASGVSAARDSVDRADGAGQFAGGQDSEGEEETMWKEKHETFLKEVHQPLVEAHDALAKRVLHLEGCIRASNDWETRLNAPSRPSAVPAERAEPAAEAATPSRMTPAASAASNGKADFDAIYRYIVERAAKEGTPAILSLLVERPELMINVERKKIEANGSTLRGALGILISEKFFDSVRVFGDVRTDLIRRGFANVRIPNVQIGQALQGLIELGFLTKEPSIDGSGGGYQAVAGMKINIVESRA